MLEVDVLEQRTTNNRWRQGEEDFNLCNNMCVTAPSCACRFTSRSRALELKGVAASSNNDDARYSSAVFIDPQQATS
jgi:hypothetical protein